MVKLRDKKKLDRPPPIYKPLGAWITLVVHHGGKFVTSPVAKYVGGDIIKLDWVVTKQLSLESVRNSIIEWLFLGEVFKIYIIENGCFKLLKFEAELVEYCKESLESREVVFYIDEKCSFDGAVKGSTSRAVDGRFDGAVKGSTSGAVEGRTEGTIEGSISGAVEGRIDVDLGSVFVPLEEVEGERKGRTDPVREKDDSDDLVDSDYDMIEESEDEDDDSLFDANVNNNIEESIEDSEDSEEEPDVVNVGGQCFDERKDSDDEGLEPHYPIFNPEVIFEPDFELGMLFGSRDEFKMAVQSHAIRTKRCLKFAKIACNTPKSCSSN